MNHYLRVFKHGRIISTLHFGDEAPEHKGKVAVIDFELFGQAYQAINGGPDFQFSEALSLSVECEPQAEVDELWAQLTADGGSEAHCGWLKDKFGVSWQISKMQKDCVLPSSVHKSLPVFLEHRIFCLGKTEFLRREARILDGEHVRSDSGMRRRRPGNALVTSQIGRKSLRSAFALRESDLTWVMPGITSHNVYYVKLKIQQAASSRAWRAGTRFARLLPPPTLVGSPSPTLAAAAGTRAAAPCTPSVAPVTSWNPDHAIVCLTSAPRARGRLLVFAVAAVHGAGAGARLRRHRRRALEVGVLGAVERKVGACRPRRHGARARRNGTEAQVKRPRRIAKLNPAN